MQREDDETLIPAAALRARYNVSDMTIWRWLGHPELEMPRPIVIQRRRYWRLGELRAWESRMPRESDMPTPGAAP